MTKEDSTQTTPKATKQTDSGLAIVSMILGVVSLTGPGLILGIPAIVTGIIALKKDSANRAFSITGLITGIVSTVISLLLLILGIFLISWSINHPQEFLPEEYYQMQDQNDQLFESSRT